MLECFLTGNKADEDKYLTENQRDNSELIKALTAIRQPEVNDSNMSSTSYGMAKSNNETRSNATLSNTTLGGSVANEPDVNRESFLELHEVQHDIQDVAEPQNHDDSSLTAHNESKRMRLDKSNSKKFSYKCKVYKRISNG